MPRRRYGPSCCRVINARLTTWDRNIMIQQKLISMLGVKSVGRVRRSGTAASLFYQNR
jgi:hypothetical protein